MFERIKQSKTIQGLADRVERWVNSRPERFIIEEVIKRHGNG